LSNGGVTFGVDGDGVVDNGIPKVVSEWQAENLEMAVFIRCARHPEIGDAKGVFKGRFHDGARADPPDRLSVLFAGRLLRSKGLDVFLRAGGLLAGRSDIDMLVAGFVEPGESLEQTVRREVFEESGIKVGPVHYRASQPWPFPSSLMLGFHATATSWEIHRHDEELEDARWFGLDELRRAGEWGDESDLSLPRRDSIARYLIQTWIEAQGP